MRISQNNDPILRFLACVLAIVTLPPWVQAAAVPQDDRPAPRSVISLNGDWEFRLDQSPSNQWKTVRVPSSFQDHEGTNFHGVGWYRRKLAPVSFPAGKRVLLHFQAAATEAQVWLDGVRLGSHMGGWTPFRFDVTDLMRTGKPTPGPSREGSNRHELLLRLDEKVGHNTQGFLPIIAPHFGGLWQEVSLLIVPETYIDDLELLAIGDPHTSELRLEFPLVGPAALVTNVSVRCRLTRGKDWVDLAARITRSNELCRVRAPFPDARSWSPAEPNLYDVEISLPGQHALPSPAGTGGARAGEGDRVQTRAAFRSISAFGQQFRLNDRPLSIRGLLNWGYSPPKVAPNPGETVWRSELELARSEGFNLMKFCLWVPPKRYLELADELGMLTWMEYPTWHPTLSSKFLEPLRTEFREFFQYDRNHPSVILRSLTCETGPSAELRVIRSLYESAHEMIPGALIEDDSSWIGWNRVHDFYDDHPYGNNHTWVKTLQEFNEYILGHGLKPLVLGETTAADTWVDRDKILSQLGAQRPWWAPAALDDVQAWESRVRGIAGPGGLAELRPDSLRYGLLMRKYQIEAYRREVPYGGYVISVIRDIPKASMGLLDYLGRPKWSPFDWRWQGDTMCLLKTENDRRSFAAGERLRGEILLSHFGQEAIAQGELSLRLESLDQPETLLEHVEKKEVEQNSGTLASLADLDWALPNVTAPSHLVIRAALRSPQGEFTNEWPIWVLPAGLPETGKDLQLHSSVAPFLRRELFPNCVDLNPTVPGANTIAVASHFDDTLVRWLESGGRVLLLPDSQQHSFPLSAHWFLRGAPYIPDRASSLRIPRDLLVELQHFDLAAEIVPDLPHLESFDPILLIWDTHDQTQVRTHGVIFETRAGAGRLLVSAARHTGANNAAGRWLLNRLVEHLRSSDTPRHSLPDELWAYLKARLHADQTNLVSRTWRFQPDPANAGLAQDWQNPDLASETEWKDIRIGAWWESQGYPELDGWAWYRLWVDVPNSWQGREIFLSFEGVDDIYELFVNGKLAGKGGDLATRKDALSEKKSHNITQFVKPGQKALLAVRVYDWYGAGGIFRPVTLGTLPINPELDLLK